MSTIFIVQHRASSYGAETTIVRAFSTEEDAQGFIDSIATIVRGHLEAKQVILEPAKTPSNQIFNPLGVQNGRVELLTLAEMSE